MTVVTNVVKLHPGDFTAIYHGSFLAYMHENAMLINLCTPIKKNICLTIETKVISHLSTPHIVIKMHDNKELFKYSFRNMIDVV